MMTLGFNKITSFLVLGWLLTKRVSNPSLIAWLLILCCGMAQAQEARTVPRSEGRSKLAVSAVITAAPPPARITAPARTPETDSNRGFHLDGSGENINAPSAGLPVNNCFSVARFDMMSPAAGWNLLAGQFGGDDQDDLVGYFPLDGSVVVGTNLGTRFSWTFGARLQPAADWQLVSGRFKGNTLDDLVGYHPSNGSLWIGENTGSNFRFISVGTIQASTGLPPTDWRFVAGRFTLDGLDDLVGYYSGDGSMWTGVNNGNGFTWTRWNAVGPPANWKFTVADIEGDGLDDLVGYYSGDGSMWVAKNTFPNPQSGFTAFNKWTMVYPAYGWSFLAGDFNGSSRDDLMGYQPANGSLWVATNTFPVPGNGFTNFQLWGTVSPIMDWSFMANRFSVHGGAWGYYPGDGSLWKLTSSQCSSPPN